MKKIIIPLLLLSFINLSYSQKIHNASEIFKLVEASKLAYNLKLSDTILTCPNYSEKLNNHDCYRIINESVISTEKYKLTEETEALIQKAEMYYQAKDLDNALLAYKSVLQHDSTVYYIMTYVGQVYENKFDRQNAILWFNKAIAKNYIDYMSHWFLADNYLAIKEIDKAVDEITIARVLNRNNTRIKKSFDRIYQKAKKDTTDWYFNPQVKIKKSADSTIDVQVANTWMGYGLCKALWLYEPGYRESMGAKLGQYAMIEDRECLITQYAGNLSSKSELKKDPQLLVLKNAVEKYYLDEYLLFDVILPNYPHVAYQLTEKNILKISEYIKAVRNK